MGIDKGEAERSVQSYKRFEIWKAMRPRDRDSRQKSGHRRSCVHAWGLDNLDKKDQERF